MRPLVLTIAGAALGLAAVLPLARAQLPSTVPTTTVQAAAVAGQSPGAAASVTVTGPVISTRYGPVQVRVTLTEARLTAATAVRLPDADGESRDINAAAGPRLDAAALAAQGAQIDTVSGATWTSDGYRRSLQAALDEARTTALGLSAATPGG